VLGQHDLAESHSDKAIALNPNDVDTIGLHGHVTTYLGDPLGGLEWLGKRQRLDPIEPEALLEKWIDAYYMARQYDEAIAVFKRVKNPPVNICNMVAACYAQLGQSDAARAMLDQIERIRPEDYDFRLAAKTHARMCKHREDGDHWLEGYRKAGFEM
jgi:tetratricopeptide (TPR) repeat protein